LVLLRDENEERRKLEKKEEAVCVKVEEEIQEGKR
jgi:hypothetical protein